MAYNRKPNYHFKTKNDTGIDKVPVGRMIIVEDFDGEIKAFIKKANVDVTDTTTVEELVQKEGNTSSVGGTFFNQSDEPQGIVGANWFNPTDKKLKTFIDDGTEKKWATLGSFIEDTLLVGITIDCGSAETVHDETILILDGGAA